MTAERKSLHRFIAPQYWHLWVGLGCLRLICLLPHHNRLAVGRLLGRLAHWLAAERRAIVRRNIELCFPDKSKLQRDDLAREHFAALGMSVVEMGMGRWVSDEQIAALCTIENLENLTEPLKAGKGVIVLSAHFTTIEVSGRAVRLAGAHYDAVYRRNRSAFVTEILRSGRERSADNTIEKRDIKQLVRRLRDGMAVWYAPDQSYKRKGAVVVPFFGVPTMHTTATSTVARLGQAVVVPFFPRRTPEGRYVLKFLPALDNFPGDDPVEDVARYISLLEEHIRSCPEQYFWIHRKFKDLPAGYDDSYADL
ncbi:MAG: lipid A biosynthesis lauroyl acyltransferase, partial [Gammaproteobacteria bacterium]|nr:lipid A biosynthesis lauroyl acyltransferase [Gammaproteobacteria bacterium]